MTEDSHARLVYFTDREGRETSEDLTDAAVLALLAGLSACTDDEAEPCAVSITDSDEWNLEFESHRVTFENVETAEEVGSLSDLPMSDFVDIAREFIDGDFVALRSRGWQ